MATEMHYGASSEIFQRAKLLRDNPTAAEQVVWEKLNKNQMGVRFRRQHPIGSFIVDFYCHRYKLVIEIDGSIHNEGEIKEHDKGREHELSEVGLKVIKFTNEEVFGNLDMVLNRIKQFIN